VYQTERMIREHGSRMSEDEKDKLERAVKDLKGSLKGNDLGAIRSDTEALMVVNQGITTRLYSEAASDGSGGGGGDYEADDEVVDAEIVDEEA
jgi:molecular chaperone DnaK